MHVDICKMPEISDSEDKLEKPDGPDGDATVQIEESTPYEDWMHKQGLDMQDTETKD